MKWRALLIVLVVLLCAGCNRPAPAMADPDQATAALKSALDAWQRGDTTDSLLSAARPIHVGDAEWESGRRLLEYKILSGQTAGFGWRCDVLLTVQSEDGSVKEHPAMYRIDTDPAIVVIHEN
jgi:hypothetical protein